MPFLQEVYEDTDFVPVPTERETYTTEAKPPEPLPRIWIHLKAPTWASFAAGLLDLHARAEASGECRNPVDTARWLEKCRVNDGVQEEDDEMETTEGEEAAAAVEETSESATIRVSVQNLVEEMVDIVAEEEEEIDLLAQDILDEVLCNMFGVAPKTKAEKVAAFIVDELLGLVVDAVDPPKTASQKKSVIVEAKVRERKRASLFDQIPEELIEKRRSSRKTKLLFEGVVSSDTSNDVAAMMTPVELLTSFLPPCLRVSSSSSSNNKRVRFSVEEKAEVKQKLFDNGGEVVKSVVGWFDAEAERRELEKFLADHVDDSVWQLLRYFLDYMFRLGNCSTFSNKTFVFQSRVRDNSVVTM